MCALSRNFLFMCALAIFPVFCFSFLAESVYATGESSLTIDVSDDDLTLNVLPMVGGRFSKSGDTTITINSTSTGGYNLMIASQSSTSMVNSNDDEVQSIGAAISESVFSTNSTYNNKWGYKPSQYVTTVSGQDTTVQNTDYLPAPSTTGDLLAVTSSASASGGDKYTLSFGARADEDLPLGSYEYTYVLTAVANVDTFPVVWSQLGACEFHGNAPSYITGSECSEYWDDYYIDTGIALNSQANASKDYEIHFTIDHYLPSENPTSKNDGQQTFVSSKVPSSTTIGGGNAPGVIVRKNGNDISFESKMNNDNPRKAFAASEVQEASLYRIDGILYVSINSGPLVLLQDLTTYNQFFDLTTWFGAYPNTNGCDGSVEKPCDTSKRYIEAVFSNMYIRLGDYDVSNLHNITFDADGGSPATTDYLVLNGNALGMLPTVARDDWLFGGWFTAQGGGGTEVTEQTVPSSDDTYWAYWYKSVTDAVIDRTDFYLSVGNTGSIEITNASDIEPYTMVSNDISVATVNQTTGVITAVGNGVTTVTITGTKTGDTRTIDVAVGDILTIVFDSQGGVPATHEWTIASGTAFRELPVPIRPGYELEGWYTGTGGTGTKLTTSTIIDSNTPSRYYANWDEVDYVCKIAKPNTLHTETCNQSGTNGCRGANIASGASIEYGQLASSSTMTAGDAYDCDVNNDGDWDDETERFYFFGSENNKAKFVYYQSLVNSDQDYTSAISYLPTATTWSNPGLVSFTGEFNGKVARFMSYSEASNLCGTSGLGVDGKCNYLLEKTAFANPNSDGYRDGVWLAESNGTACRIQTRTRVLTYGNTSANTPRPTIEVPVNLVEEYFASTYDITFDPHNETNSWTETINAGDQLGPAYPASDPTYADRTFQGWYTAQTGGTLVTSSMQPTGDATYHAQWLKHVTLADIANTNISISEGSTDTITVTNASEVESYTLTSNDASVATVDSSTGVVTGVSVGSTTITMTGVSGATRTINVTVTTAPAPFVTIHFNSHGGAMVADRTITLGEPVGIPLPSAPTYDNNHLFQGWFTAEIGGTQIDGTETPISETTYHAQWKKTVALADLDSDDLTVVEGGTTTIIVNNVSELEGYTFSSANPSVASVDAVTGVITGHVESVTTIVMTGSDSGQTKTINVHVTTDQSPYVCTLAPSDSLHVVNNITYGQVASNSTPQPGDAYDCDIDYDDTFDSSTERFYYLGTDSNDNAVLVAYNSYYNGAWAPGTSNDSVYHYDDALAELPSNASGAWDNPNLIEQATGKAARFMTKAEVEGACPGVTVTAQNSLVSCPFFMEHTAYDSGGRSALWLAPEGNNYWRVHAGTSNRNVASVSNPNSSENMVRPTIVVPYDKIEKYVVPPTQMYTVTFNSMGGSSITSAEVEGGTALGQNYPSTDPTKTDNMFFGWYDTPGYTNEVTPDTVINGDVTYYAKWVGNTTNFPIVWSEPNACIFGGRNVNVSGDYCTQLKTRDYVDTGVSLYDSTNYDKDYEVGFKVVSFTPLASQETLFNEKYENQSANWPGIMLRSNNANTEMTHKISGTTGTANTISLNSLKEVKIVRQGGVVKYAFNGGALTDLQNLNQLTRQEFNTTVWFGASATDSNVSQRQSHSTITDMYIRLGTFEESTSYTITFDGAGGTPSENLRSVDKGQPVGTLPTVTRAGNYTFLGWFDEDDNPVPPLLFRPKTKHTMRIGVILLLTYQLTLIPQMML